MCIEELKEEIERMYKDLTEEEDIDVFWVKVRKFLVFLDKNPHLKKLIVNLANKLKPLKNLDKKYLSYVLKFCQIAKEVLKEEYKNDREMTRILEGEFKKIDDYINSYKGEFDFDPFNGGIRLSYRAIDEQIQLQLSSFITPTLESKIKKRLKNNTPSNASQKIQNLERSIKILEEDILPLEARAFFIFYSLKVYSEKKTEFETRYGVDYKFLKEMFITGRWIPIASLCNKQKCKFVKLKHLVDYLIDQLVYSLDKLPAYLKPKIVPDHKDLIIRFKLKNVGYKDIKIGRKNSLKAKLMELMSKEWRYLEIDGILEQIDPNFLEKIEKEYEDTKLREDHKIRHLENIIKSLKKCDIPLEIKLDKTDIGVLLKFWPRS